MQKIVFTYWPMKGTGELVRLTMAYLGIDYIEVNPNYDNWPKDREALLKNGSAFPNLPSIEDEQLYLTESFAIPKYLARKMNRYDLLAPESIITATRFDQIEGILIDIGAEISETFMTKKWKPIMKDLAKMGSDLQRKIQYLADFLDERDFFLADRFTLIDIYVAYTSYYVQLCLNAGKVSDLIAQCPSLVAHMERVFAQPGIREYVESSKWKDTVLYDSEIARFLK